MTKFLLTNKNAFNVEGYHLTEEVTIVDVIARDIVSSNTDIEALEIAIKFGNKFQIGNYEMRAA